MPAALPKFPENELLAYQNGSDTALIVLHEIYGINRYIRQVCGDYAANGYDVYCPDLLQGRTFDYARQQEAYQFFIATVGFEASHCINELSARLRPHYRKLVLLGSSVGATIAWRCSESGLYDGVIGYYGSRIRDYTELTPSCPTFLLFAAHETSFDPAPLKEKLQKKPTVTALLFEAGHGFCDPFASSYSPQQAQKAKKEATMFLAKI